MHFCGRHTGRQVIYCIFFCQYIKVQHSKIDFTFWRRHNNVFHESRSETKSGKMEQQMQLCSSRVDSGSVPSYLVIQGLQDRSDFNTTIVARRKRQFSGAGDNWRQLKGRRFVFFSAARWNARDVRCLIDCWESGGWTWILDRIGNKYECKRKHRPARGLSHSGNLCWGETNVIRSIIITSTGIVGSLTKVLPLVSSVSATFCPIRSCAWRW